MLEFICLFFPAFLGLQIYNILNNDKKTVKDDIVHYGVYVVSINTVTLTILFIMYQKVQIMDYFNWSTGFIIKYLLIASVISIILAVVIEVIEKNLELKVRIEKNGSKKKKTN